ncbi:hypothetical protein H9P43_003593 [Blastocladiella emersonii ATCC 22665]|nr:hypothetical protein H9P43_003593 [Blastocladiella emersonii ATCC 22665]
MEDGRLHLDDTAIRALSGAFLNGLKELDLRTIDFANGCLAQLIRMLPSSLQSLHLVDSPLLLEDAQALADRMPPGLQVLQLERQLLNDESVMLLAPRLPPTLTKLTLANNADLSDVGAAVLAANLPPVLTSLNLQGTGVTAAGEAAIRAAAPWTLTELLV